MLRYEKAGGGQITLTKLFSAFPGFRLFHDVKKHFEVPHLGIHKLFRQALRKTSPDKALVLDFQLAKLRENKFMFLMSPNLLNLVITTLANYCIKEVKLVNISNTQYDLC